MPFTMQHQEYHRSFALPQQSASGTDAVRIAADQEAMHIAEALDDAKKAYEGASVVEITARIVGIAAKRYEHARSIIQARHADMTDSQIAAYLILAGVERLHQSAAEHLAAQNIQRIQEIQEAVTRENAVRLAVTATSKPRNL